MTVLSFPTPNQPLTAVVTAEIRALMARHRVSQGALAEWLDINQTAVSARLRGKTRWNLPEIDSVAQGFAVHPAELLGGASQTAPLPTGQVPIKLWAAEARNARDALREDLRARHDSNVQPSDPKVRPLRVLPLRPSPQRVREPVAA